MQTKKLIDIAKVEMDQCVRLQAVGIAPERDGFSFLLKTGLPFHAHPIATSEIWSLVQQAIADKSAAVVPWADPITIEMRLEQKRLLIDAEYEKATAVFNSRYPRTEIDGWPEQVRALDAYDADPAAANPLIDILAQHNGRTRAQMAEDIRAARTRFVIAYAQLTGLRQKLQTELAAINPLSANAAAQIAAIDETQLTALAQQLQQAGG